MTLNLLLFAITFTIFLEIEFDFIFYVPYRSEEISPGIEPTPTPKRLVNKSTSAYNQARGQEDHLLSVIKNQCQAFSTRYQARRQEEDQVQVCSARVNCQEDSLPCLSLEVKVFVKKVNNSR